MRNEGVSLTWRLYRFICFLGLLSTLGAWFFFSVDSLIVSIVLLLAIVILFIVEPNKFSFSFKNIFWFVSLFVASFLTTIHLNLNATISLVISVAPFFFIANLKDKFKSDLYIYINKCFATILLISIVAYVLFLLGISLPSYPLRRGDYLFYNHFFFLTNSLSETPRFQSVFLEPGYLGCFVSLMLFAGKYKFTGEFKMNIILLLALLLSFSLAGWLLTFFGYLTYNIYVNGKYFSKTLMRFVFIVFLVALASQYNSGDNIINETIFNRLQYDADSGTISGYNRSTDYQRDYFYNDFLKSSDVLLGVDNPTSILDNDDVDWKTFIIKYGVISFSLLIFFLIITTRLNLTNRLLSTVFVLVYFLIFCQTIFGVFWFSYLLILVLGLNEIKRCEMQ